MVTVFIYNLIVLFQLYVVCRNKTVSIKELLQTFLVGASAVSVVNFLVQGIAVRIWGSDVVVFTVGPVSEEILKIAFIVFLLFRTRLGKTSGIEDGLLLGAAAGAGYAFSEDTIRALGMGLSDMLWHFPGYDPQHLLKMLGTWLPNDRMGVMRYSETLVPGHILWTALVGFGVALARKIPHKFTWRYFIPLVLLVWVIVDHSLVNNPYSMLRPLYKWYGWGWGIRYAVTWAVFLGILADELILLRQNAMDSGFLLPNEKKRSFFGELWITLSGWRFGRKYWVAALDYIRLRRQLAFAAWEGDKTQDVAEMLKKRWAYAVMSASFPLKVDGELTYAIERLWSLPLVHEKFSLQTFFLRIYLLSAGIAMVFSLWVFFFSAYFPRSFVIGVYRGPLFMVMGIIGYLVTTVSLVLFIRKKPWQGAIPDPDNRLRIYSEVIVIIASGIIMVAFIPDLFGSHPLLIDKFLWQQIDRLSDLFRTSWVWIGGLASLVASFTVISPFFDLYAGITGRDFFTGERLSRYERIAMLLLAPIGIGRLFRGLRLLYKYRAMRKIKPLGDALVKLHKWSGRPLQVEQGLFYSAETALKIKERVRELDEGETRLFYHQRHLHVEQLSIEGTLQKTFDGVYTLPAKDNTVEVYIGKKAMNQFAGKYVPFYVGEITIDHTDKTIVFDDINEDGTHEALPDLQNKIKSLQKKLPGYRVVYKKIYRGGYTKTQATMPDGTSDSFYTSPSEFSN